MRTASLAGTSLLTLTLHRAHKGFWGGVSPDALDAYRRRYCRHLLRLFGVEVDLSPPPPPKRASCRLVVANHRTVLDIPVLVAAFGGAALSRADVSRWPILGYLAREGGTIFVDRADRTSGAVAIRTMRRSLRDGATLIVFPEGGTHRGDEVRPFHAGAFAAARGLDVEIVPVGIATPPGLEYVDISFAEHLREVGVRDRVRVVARVGVPMSLTGAAGDVAERTRQAVQELVNEARGVADASPGHDGPV